MKDEFGHYQHVSGEEEETQETILRPRSSNRLRVVAISLALLFATLLGMVVGTIQPIFIPFWPDQQITDCGRTSSEARARGCVLEPMVYGWMPPQCQFPEVTKQNDPFKKWQWYADENMTIPLTEEQLWRGESIDLWTNVPGYHLEHCLFLYRKLMYGVQHKATWLDKKTLGSHHAYHCVDILSTSTEAWNATTWTGLAMYTCERTPWS